MKEHFFMNKKLIIMILSRKNVFNFTRADDAL